MPLKKFGDDDIFHNTLKSFPKNQFDVYGGKVYYQNESQISGAFTGSVPCIPTGFVSLYELNVDRNATQTGLIFPTIDKGSSLTTFKSVSTASFNSALYGQVFTRTYPLSASISRELITQYPFSTPPISSLRITALRSSMDAYTYWSPQYQFSASIGDWGAKTPINLISIPSIFY